ncbi:hypothetical protein K491DRAFT_679956 [Lophiostoma macrostomum CBS 122681]|uniref:Uncharacterized protein n=1 Tax=Lophiostoma macrostomum CBS 122681 TaxID=1314788 RepID=A0A6A6T5P2_9PLEO|nr:hypothetical protein K491DRAFT_679956 [Lophiostoma macrostomum CBS 122681]
MPQGTVGHEILVVSDDDEAPVMKGGGSADDPIQLSEWITGNIISATEHGAFVDLDSDEEGPAPENQPPGKTAKLTREGADNVSRFIDVAGGSLKGATKAVAGVHQSRTPQVEKNGDDFGCEVIIISEDDDPESDYKYTQDWSSIKEEPTESVPELTFSQASEATATQDSLNHASDAFIATNVLVSRERLALQKQVTGVQAACGQVAKVGDDRQPEVIRSPRLWEKDLFSDQAEKTKMKKHLFFYTYGPRQLPHLTKVVQRYRSYAKGGMSRSECWLSTDP